jgi:hypothetical protein
MHLLVAKSDISFGDHGGALVFFHLKNKQILDDETSSWCIFSSLIITTLFKMIINRFSTEIRDKIWSILVNSSLLLGLFLLVLIYMSHWPFSTCGIYLPFFMVPVFLPFHDISATPPYIKKLSKIAGLDGAECHLLFVFIYNMALMIVVLTASKLEEEFNAPWWTTSTVFSVAYSLYLMWLEYALYKYNNKVLSRDILSCLCVRVHIISDILFQFILIIFLSFISLMIEWNVSYWNILFWICYFYYWSRGYEHMSGVFTCRRDHQNS